MDKLFVHLVRALLLFLLKIVQDSKSWPLVSAYLLCPRSNQNPLSHLCPSCPRLTLVRVQAHVLILTSVPLTRSHESPSSNWCASSTFLRVSPCTVKRLTCFPRTYELFFYLVRTLWCYFRWCSSFYVNFLKTSKESLTALSSQINLLAGQPWDNR